MQAALAARLRDRALHDSLTASQVSKSVRVRQIHVPRRRSPCSLGTCGHHVLDDNGKTGVSSQVLVSHAAARIKHMEHRSLNAASKILLAGLAWQAAVACK